MEIHIDLLPRVLFTVGGVAVTNTLLTSWIAALLVIVFAVLATRKMDAVPRGIQNVGEAVVEVLLTLCEQVAGSRARRFLPLVATLFLYILAANWMGVLPGVGSLPMLRSATSDLSITAGMALIVFLWVQWAGLRANPKAYFLKFVWPPGLNVLETISEFTRPLALALRLFGNMLAGYVLVEVMLQVASPGVPAVFMALELGVGLLQALIFAVLTLAFLLLATSHGHDEGRAEAEAAAH